MRGVQDFDGIKGHESVVRFIRAKLNRDEYPNVSIYHGQPGIGKTSIAKLVAVSLTAGDDEKLRKEYVDMVINKNVSTDSIKLFNMSEIDSEEAIAQVKSEMNIGFSSTGRKVLILDEAHRISERAQDSVLVELEHLDKGVYIILCTTEIGSLRSSLVSRSKATFKLNSLTERDSKAMIRDEIQRRGLTFKLRQDVVVALVSDWANNQPRNINNLLSNFYDGETVSTEDLSVFINTSSKHQIVRVIDYLYGSLTLGVELMMSLTYDDMFITALVDILKVALGGNSKLLEPDEVRWVQDKFKNNNLSNFIKFTREVMALDRLEKRKVTSIFMTCHHTAMHDDGKVVDILPVQQGDSIVEDMATMASKMERNMVTGKASIKVVAPSLEDLFANSEGVTIEG